MPPTTFTLVLLISLYSDMSSIILPPYWSLLESLLSRTFINCHSPSHLIFLVALTEKLRDRQASRLKAKEIHCTVEAVKVECHKLLDLEDGVAGRENILWRLVSNLTAFEEIFLDVAKRIENGTIETCEKLAPFQYSKFSFI